MSEEERQVAKKVLRTGQLGPEELLEALGQERLMEALRAGPGLVVMKGASEGEASKGAGLGVRAALKAATLEISAAMGPAALTRSGVAYEGTDFVLRAEWRGSSLLSLDSES